MNDTKTKNKPINTETYSISEERSPHKLINHLFDQVSQIMLRFNNSIKILNNHDADNSNSAWSIKLKRTAEDINISKGLLIRRIGLDKRFDLSTDKLICQLKIQTNRLMVQLDELDDEISEKQSDMKFDHIAV